MHYTRVASCKMRLQSLLIFCVISVALCQQRFRVRPSNMSAVEGETVILQCEVTSQAGDCQWTKDGFAFGYSRDLPGYDRYRMVGDAALGENNLRIERVTASDSGRFQCQVSPRHGQLAIKTDAYLDVYLKPKKVRLMKIPGSAGIPSAGTSPGIEAASSQDDPDVVVMLGEKVTLQCDIIGSRPASQVVWLKNDIIFDPEIEKVAYSGSTDANTNDTQMVITLNATEADDGAKFTCRPLHPSLRADQQNLLGKSLLLQVLYPPGHPSITVTSSPALPAYDSGTTPNSDGGDTPTDIQLHSDEDRAVVEGHQVTITCRSVGGNPVPDLTMMRNGRPLVEDITTTASSMSSTGELLQPSVVETQLSFTATPADAGVLFRCLATSPVQPQPLEATYTPVVLYGPRKVSVSAVQPATAGQVLNVTCSMSECYPMPEIMWTINQQNTVALRSEQLHSSKDDRDDHLRFQASVMVPASLAGDSIVVGCIARNPRTGVQNSASVQTQLFYAPRFDLAVMEVTAEAGRQVVLNASVDARPDNVNYTWWRQGRRLESSSADIGGTPMLVLAPVDRLDGGVYTVRASNSQGTSSAEIHLSVLYTPSVEMAPQHTVDQGGDVSLLCKIDAHPLETDMVSWSGPRDLLSANADTSSSSDIASTEISLENSTSILRLRNVSELDIGIYNCTVDNAMGTAAASTSLLVRHSPYEIGDHLKSAVDPGDIGRLACEVRSYPAPEFGWFRNNVRVIAGDHFNIDNSQIDTTIWLSILTVQQTVARDFGLYECRASNQLGTSRQQVTLQLPSAPEAPLNLTATRVVATDEGGASKSTHVDVRWRAAFDGGRQQSFRVKYVEQNDREVQVVDVGNKTHIILRNLASDSAYNISVASFNAIGTKGFLTSLFYKTGADTKTLAESSLFSKGGLWSSDKGASWLLKVVVFGVVATLLIINFFLVAFIVRRKRNLRAANAHSQSPSEASTKSETVQTYVNETTSSVSLKSEGFTAEDIPDHYRVEITSDTLNTYSGHQDTDCPVTGTPSTIHHPPNPHNHNHLHQRPPPVSRCQSSDNTDGYVDALRSNSYSYTTGSLTDGGGSIAHRTNTLRPPRAPFFVQSHNQQLQQPAQLANSSADSCVSTELAGCVSYSRQSSYAEQPLRHCDDQQRSLNDGRDGSNEYAPRHYEDHFQDPPADYAPYSAVHLATQFPPHPQEQFSSMPQYRAAPIHTGHQTASNNRTSLPVYAGYGSDSVAGSRTSHELPLDYEHQGHLV